MFKTFVELILYEFEINFELYLDSMFDECQFFIKIKLRKINF